MSRTGVLVALLLGAFPPLAAQAPAAPERAPWTIGARIYLWAEADDNIYRLSATQLADLANPDFRDVISGRYALMPTGGDEVLRTRFEGVLEGPGLGGRPLRVLPAIEYESFRSNTERSNLRLDLEVEQDLRRGRALKVQGRYTPRYFHRNYLADAVDADGDLRIQREERVYARGDFSELELRSDFQMRLRDSKRDKPLRVYAIVGLGYSAREYDAPFVARSTAGLSLRGRLRVEPTRRIAFVTTVDVARLNSPVRDQTVLIDEVLLGEDLNGNGSAFDNNVRVVTPADRSRDEQWIEQRVTVRIGERLEVAGTASQRWRQFTSEGRLDIANRDRRDSNTELSLEAEYRLSRAIRILGRVRQNIQRLNQIEDLGAEGTVDDYRRNRVELGLRLSR